MAKKLYARLCQSILAIVFFGAGQIAHSQQCQVPYAFTPGDNATWTKLATSAVAVSMGENQNNPQLGRVCDPSAQQCYIGLFFKVSEKQFLLRITQDLDGRQLAREICSFNDYGDVRDCVNWDTMTCSRAVKDQNGQWVNIGH